MADVPVIYIAKVEGEERARFYRSTDPRLVRRHILEGLPVPEIDVRRATAEEGWDAGLDGVPLVDLTKKAPAEPDLLTNAGGSGNAPNGADATDETGGSAPHSPSNMSLDDPGVDRPRLAPGETIDNDGEIHSDDPELERQEVVQDDPFTASNF